MPEQPDPIKNDVLHSESHSKLSAEEIAKAVARHKREHASARQEPNPKSKKPNRSK